MPFAFVDLDLLEQNIHDILQRRGTKKIRVASKSVRSIGVLKRILSAEPDAFSGVMSFTANEALYLCQEGIQDILLGYPVWSPKAIQDLARAINDGHSITLMIDSLEHVTHINSIGERTGIVIPVCLDVDMSTNFPGLHFGVWRSPISNVAQAKPVIDKLLRLPFIRLDGLMGYEAQIAGVGDQYPGQRAKNALVQQLKRRSVSAIASRRTEVVEYILSQGIQLKFVNGGGTGSLETTKREKLVTEITVGSGFYSPGLFDNYRSFQYQPALGFAIEVVRQPAANIVTCAGGGYVASGAAAKDKLPKPYLPADLQLISLEGAGEVQTPFQVPQGVSLSLGDPVFMRHSKAGELCERFNSLYCVQNGAITDIISTYRGDGKCFL
ncbi:amino acid aldolase [Alicyclobacillus ferrooxydans]|uniref:Amino acid aldolase n=2 Tax=Alicyclobacillus ferrooxydans TaxID=471514 RepID=A0A0P9D8N4_9BACL|nr:amino acid deaminase/aldolase [Alicyclobacillus ferrooxydans]KPV45726.1 amino acid aldolase [Alicyclobacillus ferrooxydans]